MTGERTYEDGVLQGRLEERVQSAHAKADDAHERIDTLTETVVENAKEQARITYGILGALTFINLWPTLKELISN